MNPLACPKCGAEVKQAPQGANCQCQYCGTVFASQIQAPPPPPPQQQHESAPRFVVIHHNHSDSDHGHGHSMFSLYWLIRAGIAIVFVTVTSGGWAWRHFSGIGGDIWDGKEPLACSGNEQIEVKGVTATFTAGAAIVASGNCKITCKDCIIKAPIGVESSANAQVVLVNGSVEGTEQSLVASSNSKIDVRGNAKVTGPWKQSSNAKVSGVPSAVPAAVAAAPRPLAAAAATPASTPAPRASAVSAKKK